MPNDRTMTVFNATAATYDTDRARLIPGYAALYARVIELLPSASDHVLDLGAGTGLLSAFVRESFPDARLHLIDNAPAMLAQAETRFSRDQEVLCQLADYTDAPWGSAYDAIISALSIHHLTDRQKRHLFSRIVGALKPGGVFVNLEQVLAPTAELEQEAKAAWLAAVRDLGATEDQIAASLLRQTEDRCATVGDQLNWMREAGLETAQNAFHQGRFAVLTGVRPL